MKSKSFNISILVILIIYLFSCNDNRYKVKMYAKGQYGINHGDIVTLEESEIGLVSEVEKFTRDSVLFILELDKMYLLTKDSKFIITNSSLLGESFIKVKKGKKLTELILDGDTVTSVLKPNYKLDSMINTFNNILDSTSASVSRSAKAMP